MVVEMTVAEGCIVYQIDMFYEMEVFMKKIVLAIVMTVCLMLAFAACSGANGDSDSSEYSDMYDSDNEKDAEAIDDSDDIDYEEDSDDSGNKNDDIHNERPGTQDKSLLKPYLGRWEYENKNVHIGMEADFTWSMYDILEDGSMERVSSGTFTIDEKQVYLYDKKDNFVMSIESISTNNLMDDQGENLYRYIASN